MKRAKRRRRQNSIMGFALAEALLRGSAASAAPNSDDRGPHGTGKSGADVTRLITGDPARIVEAVLGSPPTAILAFNPVPVPAGVTPPNPYPPGTTIVGNELRAEVGGFRAWFNVQVSNWDPNGDGLGAIAYQVKIDCTNYKGVNAVPPNPGVDLAPAVVLCTNTGICRDAFGEPLGKCYMGRCLAGYLDWGGLTRPDSWCAPSGGGCNTFGWGGPFEGNCNYYYWSVSDLTTGHPDEPSTCVGGMRNGGGCTNDADCPSPGTCTGSRPVYYGGTLVLDIPPAARGRYIVSLNQDETFIAGPVPGGPPVDIPTLVESGFVVNIGAGQCCYGLRTPEEGCIDGVIRSECEAQPGPVVFTLDQYCPPDGPDCNTFLGACCQTISGECVDYVREADCQGTHAVWRSGTSCAEVDCAADTGACCDGDPFGPCTDDIVSSDCTCATCTWHKHQACDEVDCAATPIPTASQWGLAVLTLLLMIGAKIAFGGRGMVPAVCRPLPGA